MAEKTLDLTIIVNAFTQSLDGGGGDVGLDKYIEAYEELHWFLGTMGTVFGFVSSDVKSKVSILNSHLSSDKGTHYQTVNSMVEYEVKNGLLGKGKSDLPNGCRTLLRLHRALKFLIRLFNDIKTSKNSDKMSDIAHKAYTETLAEHHTWIVRKGVGMAVYILPSRKDFLLRMNAPSEDATQDILGELVTSSQKVYEEIQKIYVTHKLLQLP